MGHGKLCISGLIYDPMELSDTACESPSNPVKKMMHFIGIQRCKPLRFASHCSPEKVQHLRNWMLQDFVQACFWCFVISAWF